MRFSQFDLDLLAIGQMKERKKQNLLKLKDQCQTLALALISNITSFQCNDPVSCAVVRFNIGIGRDSSERGVLPRCSTL